MDSSSLQRTAECIFAQGAEFTFDIAVEDSKGVAIDLTAVTVTTIILRAYEFWEDPVGSQKISLTGTVFDDGGNGKLRFVFTSGLTSSLTPQTYLYYVNATIDMEKVTVIKDLLTLLRGINP